jgi:hypothetical protein
MTAGLPHQSKIPAQGETATFFVNGSKWGEGMLLLYPDELIAVTIMTLGTWIYLGVAAMTAAVTYFVFHTIGWGLLAIWLAAGWWFFQSLDKQRAARRVADGGERVTVIPLEQVTSVQTRKPTKVAGWMGLRNVTVSTADGTEYEFRGTMEKWHTHLTQALTAHGREVHAESENLTVLPWATLGEG